MSHNNQKKIAMINDISGFGRCSISVAMPLVSYLGVQCCPIPTSIFSNHTGFSDYFFDDYTDKMQSYIDKWKTLNLKFEGIMTGFIGSKDQIQIVKKFIEDFKDERTTVIVDPAMGENGKPYATYTKEMCNEMKKLVEYADIITPNVTECCLLTDTPYKQNHWTRKELFDMAGKLLKCGAKKIVISGVDMGKFVGNVVVEEGKEPQIVRRKKIGEYRSGTGDIYAAIIASDSINGVEFYKSVKKAANFVQKCIVATEKLNIPKTDGLAFEEVLYTLKRN